MTTSFDSAPLIEIEQTLLGRIITDGRFMAEVVSAIPAEGAFENPAHNVIWSAMQELAAQEIEVDYLTLVHHLEETKSLVAAGDRDTISAIMQAGSTGIPIENYCKIIRAAAARRVMLKALEPVQGDSILSTSEMVACTEQAVIEARDTLGGLLSDGIESTICNMENVVDTAISTEDKTDVGLTTPIPSLSKILGPMIAGELVLIGAPPSMGKEQRLSAKVLQPSGNWRRMGDLVVGNRLASVDGAESIVSGVFPQGVKPIYAITMSDGRVVEAGAEHLWVVESSRFEGTRKVTTAQIAEMIGTKNFSKRLRLVQHTGEFGDRHSIQNGGCQFDLDPWLLGFLLGDGCLTKGVSFSNTEPYIIDRVAQATQMRLTTPPSGPSHDKDWHIFHGKGKTHPVKDTLENLGVMGLRSYEKFIPELVFEGTRPFREQVLAGLLESDGWVEKFGSLQYSSSSEQLADGVMRLVYSLSGRASRRFTIAPQYKYRGEKRIGRPSYGVSIAVPGIENILKSPRLLKNLKRSRPTSPVIMSVDYVDNDQAQCITVSHPSGLYITDNYLVTHNTSLAIGIVRENVMRGKKLLYVSLDETTEAVYRRLLVNATGITSQTIRAGGISQEDGDKLYQEAAKYLVRDKDCLTVIDKSGLTVADIGCVARRIKGLDGIFVDYLQQVKPTDSKANRVLQVGAIARELKGLAKDFQIPVIAMSQLNRSYDNLDGDQPPRATMLRDSGELEQEANTILLLWIPAIAKKRKDGEGSEEQKKVAKAFKNSQKAYLKATIVIAKGKELSTSAVPCLWDGPRMAFFEEEIHHAEF